MEMTFVLENFIIIELCLHHVIILQMYLMKKEFSADRATYTLIQVFLSEISMTQIERPC